MDLRLFLKDNKKEKGTTTYPATKSLCDENGKPLEWVIKAISTKENADIRENCIIEVPVKGKPGMFRNKLNTTKYMQKLICACVVEPNLYDKTLQDSYGVMTPEDLLMELIDNPSEYDDFSIFIQQYNGFDVGMEEKVEEAKN